MDRRDELQLFPLIKGAATYVPGLYRPERGSTGGTVTARYCYSVWLRHLRTISAASGQSSFARVAELGPGDSLGIGLAALLSGASHLEALDVVRYAPRERNRAILLELAALFRKKERIPDDSEFPRVQPKLRVYDFPSDLLDGGRLANALSEARVARIGAAVDGMPSDVSAEYRVPWDQGSVKAEADQDLVYSQAVLEHVEDINATHSALARRLRPGGIASHAVDFRSHCITPGWDGHLQYSPGLWRIVKGRRPYLLNRRSPTEHLTAMERTGFRILREDRITQEPTLSDRKLAGTFRSWSREDRRTAAMTIVAQRNTQDAG